MEDDGSKKGLRAASPCRRDVIYDVFTSPTMWSEIRGLTETLAYSPCAYIIQQLVTTACSLISHTGRQSWKLQGGEFRGQKARLRKRWQRGHKAGEKKDRREGRENPRDVKGLGGGVRCGKRRGGLEGRKDVLRKGWKSGERQSEHRWRDEDGRASQSVCCMRWQLRLTKTGSLTFELLSCNFATFGLSPPET